MTINRNPDDGGLPNDPIPEPDPSAIKVWTSIEEGAVIPAAWGRVRLPSIVLYKGTTTRAGGFHATDRVLSSINNESPRKGSGVPVVLGVAVGPITGFLRFFRGEESSISFGQGLLDRLGFGNYDSGGIWRATSTNSAHLGTGLTAFARPSLEDPDPQGQGWEGVAQFRSDCIALDDSGELYDLAWEIDAFRAGAGGDADPADVVLDLCTSAEYGLGMSASQVQVDVGLDGLAASSFRRWCQANDFRVSGHSGGTTKKAALEALAASCYSTVLFSEGKVKLVPLGAEPLTANGYTYTPPAPVVLDALDWKDMVIDRVPDDDVFNTWAVRFDDRATNYESRIVPYQDGAHAAAYGRRPANEVEAPWLKTRARAFRLAQYRCKESIYQRTRLRFSLSRRYSLLEPGDLVSLDLFGVTRTFRIRSFDQPRGGRWPVQATEVPAGSSTPIDLTPGSSSVPPGVAWNSSDGKADADLGNVTAQLGGGNFLRNATFDAGLDTDGGGSTRGWGLYNDAAVPAFISRVATGGRDGGAYCRVNWTSGAPTQIGVYTRAESGHAVAGKAAGVPWQVGRWYTISGYARASVTGTARVGLAWNRPPSSVITVAAPDLTSEWQRFVYRVRWNAGQPIWSELFLNGNGGALIGAGAGSIDFDHVQVEEADVVTAFAPRTDEILPSAVSTQELADGSVTGLKLSVDALQTSNYAEAAGVPTAGAKLDKDGLALKVATGSLRFGKYFMSSVAVGVVQGKVKHGTGNNFSVEGLNLSSASWYYPGPPYGTNEIIRVNFDTPLDAFYAMPIVMPYQGPAGTSPALLNRLPSIYGFVGTPGAWTGVDIALLQSISSLSTGRADNDPSMTSDPFEFWITVLDFMQS